MANLEALLDNPIWHSLITQRAAVSQGGDLARRFDPEIGPLAGIKDQSPEAYAELGSLLAPGEFAALFLDSPPTPPQNWQILKHSPGDQMIFTGALGDTKQNLLIRPLGDADVSEMLELTALTDPGPFRSRTIELGGFIGIREDGRLAAMAGRRLALPGFTEVSAVCTHPDFRGRGYAQTLVSAVSRALQEQGETPILHVYSSNSAAIRVYESLGFVLRRKLHVAVVMPPVPQA